MQYKNIIIDKKESIRKALQLLEKSGKKFLLAIDELKSVKGVLTDGDIRRGLLNGLNLDDCIDQIIKKNFLFVKKGEPYKDIQQKALDLGIDALPILDEDKKLLEIVWLDSRLKLKEFENNVIIMAGGRGRRLNPLTEEIPKPMIEINGLPMIHHLILRMKKQGFYKFIISVNYKKEKIKDYLGDGSRFDIKINYTEEVIPLGTAGSLSLVPKLKLPALVLNADVVTDINFQDLLIQNKKTNAHLVVITKNEKISIPYGVVETNGSDILAIKEKPSFDFLINTGIYLITEEIRLLVSKNKFLDMPSLTRKAIENHLRVEHYLCTNNWIDVGRFETLKKAKDFIE